MTLSELLHIKGRIREHIFPAGETDSNWINMCMVITYGNTTKSRIEKTYHSPYYRTATTQNTVVDIDKDTFYYGLGGSVKLDKTVSQWLFFSSMPQFFITKVKSKNDIANHISRSIDFIKENKKIFKNVTKLKDFEYKYEILPEQKREDKERREQEKEEERYKKSGIRRRYPKRRAAQRRPIRKGSRNY